MAKERVRDSRPAAMAATTRSWDPEKDASAMENPDVDRQASGDEGQAPAINGRPVVFIGEADPTEAVFSPWLGDPPCDRRFKNVRPGLDGHPR